MENSWYTKLNEHPQFGYSVSLAKPGDVPVVIISAPGNPSFEFSDPGFVELQKLDDPPSKLDFFAIISFHKFYSISTALTQFNCKIRIGSPIKQLGEMRFKHQGWAMYSNN